MSRNNARRGARCAFNPAITEISAEEHNGRGADISVIYEVRRFTTTMSVHGNVFVSYRVAGQRNVKLRLH